MEKKQPFGAVAALLTSSTHRMSTASLLYTATVHAYAHNVYIIRGNNSNGDDCGSTRAISQDGRTAEGTFTWLVAGRLWGEVFCGSYYEGVL